MRVNSNSFLSVGFISVLLLSGRLVDAQPVIAFVSDTQEPMAVEKLVLKPNQNARATRMILHELLQLKPTALFALGDVVSKGARQKKWRNIDQYLDSCRKAGTHVSALLGNHDVMPNDKNGEREFQKRFPDHNRLGFFKVVDSVAIVLLNSNFGKLSKQDLKKQNDWLHATLQQLDANPSVLTTIVTCHHAPYTNSKIVSPSKDVQRNFVTEYQKSAKARLFITGHSHNFEHFIVNGKDFLVIGGGGGLSQPRSSSAQFNDVAPDYKPFFHYLLVRRTKGELIILSRYLKADFSGFENGSTFVIKIK